MRRTEGAGFAWTAFVPGIRADKSKGGVGHAPSATEAVWRAVDSIRSEDDRLSGLVEIFSLDGESVARAPLWAVPQFDLLEWEPAAVPIGLATDAEPTESLRAPAVPQ